MSLLLTLALVAAGPLDGEWEFRMDRGNWKPKYATGVLEFRDGAKAGTLFLRECGFRTPTALEGIRVFGGKEFTFYVNDRVTNTLIHFDGRIEKGRLVGEGDWAGCGKFPFTAERLARFDEGLSFSGFLPKGDAEALGMRGPALDRLVREAGGTDSDALLVLKGGKVVAERYFGREKAPIPIMSVTKAVTALAVLLLVEDGKIPSLDEPLGTWFPDWKEGAKAKVTLRHVLGHTSGLRHGKTAEALNGQKDRVRYARDLPLDGEPGKAFEYSNEAVALLSGVVRAASGRPLDEYLRVRLTDALGVGSFRWVRDGAGSTVAYAQLFLEARQLALIGQFVVQEGKWKEKPLMKADWIARLLEPGAPCRLLWWIRAEKGGLYHSGDRGQWLAVYPAEDLVAVRLRRGWRETIPEEEALQAFPSFLDMVEATIGP